jgi:hypothetical protein
VAKCVVCSKSAGPFHSLHKICLPRYQDTRRCLREKFAYYISAEEFSEDVSADISANIIDTLNACASSAKFSKLHFKELFVKVWQEQAKLTIKDSSPHLLTAKKLVHLADGFDVNDDDVDEYLYTRLYNVQYLELLQNKESLNVSLDVPEGIELNSNESIIWEFKQTTKQEQQRYSQEKQWTVFSSVLNSILMKKRYKELAVKSQKSGALLVTNQGLLYQHNNAVTQTKFSEIHSITPMKNGVRIQANTKGAMPDTYVTGDGRFTFALLQYAQRLQD